MNIKCPYCEECFSRTSLTRHVSRKHKISPKELSILIDYNNKQPICECGCGLEVTFNKGKFRRFYHGHANKDPIIRQKMIDGGTEASKDKEKLKKVGLKLKKLWEEGTEYRKKHIQIRNDPNSSWRKINVKKLIDLNQSIDNKNKLSEKAKLRWQDKEWSENQLAKLQSDEFREKVSKATTIALSNPETRELLSKSAKNSFLSGRRVPKSNWENIKGEYKINPNNGENEWMDSGWEMLFAETCDLENIKYLKNGHHKILYNGIDLKEHIYHPDFYLPDRKHLIEIKGRILENDQMGICAVIL